MSKPMIRIHNVLTGEIIDREMTNEEFAAYESEQQTRAAQQAEAEAKANAKAALLDKLGITAEEAVLLLS
jgi:hypothetical protein